MVRQGVWELESGHAVTKEWNGSDAVHRAKKAGQGSAVPGSLYVWLLTKLSAAAAKHIDITYMFKLF